MNLAEAVKGFFSPEGRVVLPDNLTMAGLCERLYQADAATGGAHRHCLRFWDYSASREGEVRDYDRQTINTRIKVVAARLGQIGSLGDKVGLLMGNSPEYVFGFLGAMYAGMIPVPLYDPNEPGHGEHLQAVLAECEPKIVLTNRASAAAVRAVFAGRPGTTRPRILAVDALPDALADCWVNPLETEQGKAAAGKLAESGTAPADAMAFLQYTSGSTRTPAGVMLTHRSVLTNALQIFVVAQFKMPARMVSWLPMHHDMGIVLAAMFTILGMEFDVMRPRDFIQQPSRWLEQLSRRSDDDHSYTAVPNFALELAVRYAAPDENTTLDLSNVDNLILGAEPVTAQALEAFADTFSSVGFARSALRPSYGQAESSLLITTPNTENRPIILRVDRARLSENTIVPSTDDASDEASATLVSCGQPIPDESVIVVDPDTRRELPDGCVGELWAHGNNVAAGYAGRDELTAAVFANTLAQPLKANSHAAGVADDAYWLATGDLGARYDGEVFITGRRKELIIIAGRNHYPQDIEHTVFGATSQVRPGCAAAFSAPGDDVEKLVIFAERDLEADPSSDRAAVEAIRTAVTAAHGVSPADVRIVEPDTIARSSSGKIARAVLAKRYAEGLFDE